MDNEIKPELAIEVEVTQQTPPPNYHLLNVPSHQMFVQNLRETDDVWMTETDDENNLSKTSMRSPKSSFLDPANWRRIFLDEEAAIEKFNKRATEPKYLHARYKCTECYTNFAREEKLLKHIQINHTEAAGNHICLFCQRRFQKACKLRMHVKKHYFQIECLRCNMTFCGEGLAFQHEEFHRGVLITCKYCSQQFKHKSTYYQHVRNQHRSNHICSLCGASFCSRAGLNVHKKRLHNNEKDTLTDQNIYCNKCDIRFATVTAYQEHYRHSTLHAEGVDLPYIIENLPPETVPPTVVSEDPMKMYVRCSVCQESFYGYAACMRHHRARHPALSFMSKPPAPPPRDTVRCDVCGAVIKATSLYTHMNAHTRSRIYKCDQCDMEFPYPTSLLRHKVTHTGEKKYPCSICDKRFTQRNSMKLHYRTFHLKEPYPKRNRKKKPQMSAPEQMNYVMA